MSRNFSLLSDYETDERTNQIKELSKSMRKLTYPPPAPPVNKNCGKEDFGVIDKQEMKLILATTEDQHSISFDDLVSFLTKDLTTEVQKVRALYMWISWQNLTEATSYTRDHPVSLPYGYLKYVVEKRKYLWEFFAHLCRLAGLPCLVIRGLSKSIDWSNSRWNAVYVDGSWQLVHIEESFISSSTGGTTLDLLKVEHDGKAVRERSGSERKDVKPFYEKKFDDFFFLTDPEHFVHFFLPEEEQKVWQLLQKPWSFKKFINNPCVTQNYFNSGWRMSKQMVFVTKAPNGRCAIWFDDIPRNEELNKYDLYFHPESSNTPIPDELQRDSYVIVNASPKFLFTRLPVAGRYRLYISNKDQTELLFLYIVCSGPIKKQPFPFVAKAGFGFGNEAQGAGLSDPLHQNGVLKAREGEKIRFKFHKPTSKEVRIRLVHHNRGSDVFASRVTHEQREDHVTISVRVPYDDHNPEYGLQIDTCEGDSEFNNVLNYLITHDQQVTCVLQSRKKQVRDNLKMAMDDDDDAEVLENALSEYRAFGGDGKGRHAHDNNEGLILQACRKLHGLQRQALDTASLQNDPKTLEEALSFAERSQLAFFLRRTTWYKQAKERHKKLRRLSLITKNITNLRPTHVREIKSYSRPHVTVQKTLVATYILLGEAPDTLEKWSNVQALLRMRGSKAIMERIKNCKFGDLNEERVQKAAALLRTFRWEEVRAVSNAAGAFYQWCDAVVRQFQDSRKTSTTLASEESEVKETSSAA